MVRAGSAQPWSCELSGADPAELVIF